MPVPLPALFRSVVCWFRIFGVIPSGTRGSLVLTFTPRLAGFGRAARVAVLAILGVLGSAHVAEAQSPPDPCAADASTPGCQWTIRTSADDSEWLSVAYGNGLWVAIAAQTGTELNPGTHQVMTSPDGITWTARTAAAVSDWRSVAFGNGLWVAVASSGTDRVMTSTDGMNWTARAAASESFWRGVVYGEDANGNGLWVAVASSGDDRVMTSPDGVSWTAQTSPVNSWFSLAYGKGGDGNGLWVATAIAGSTGRVMTSPDGVNWTERISDPACCNHYFSVAFGKGADGNGLWVAVSNTNNAPGSRVMTSPDGVTWTARTAASDSQWRGVAYGNGLWVAVAAEGPDRVMTSPDGITWTARAAANDNGWRSVAYASGLWVAVALSGEGDRVMTSGAIHGLPSQLAITTQPENAVSGSAITPAITVQVQDQFGVPVVSSTAAVTLAIGTNSGLGTLSGTKTVNAVPVNGVATFSDLSIDKAGAGYTLVASADGLTGATSNRFDITVGEATQVAVSAGDNQSSTVGLAVPTAPSVVVRDVGGNPVSGVAVTFEVASGGGTITPASPATVTTDVNGVAALTSWTLGVTAGPNTLTATIAGSDPAISTTFTASAFSIPGAPGALHASPGNGSVDLVWSPPSDLGGGVTSYEVQSSGGSQATSFGSGVHTSARFTGLTNGALATFQVRAVNPAGAGPWSEAVTAVPQASSVKGWSWVSELSADDAVAWRGLVFADGQFVAVGADAVMRSPTGQTWALEAAPPAGTWTGLASGEGVLVATATGGTDRVMRSTDNGVTWSAVTPPEANAWWSVAYGDGVFVAVASSGTNRVMRSEDAGITWEPIAGIADQQWYSVTYGNGAFVAVGVGTAPVMRSTDGGRTWSSATAPASNSWFSVTYGNGVFVAIGQGTPGTLRAIRSVDGGLTWTAQVTPIVNWRAVAYGEGVFVGTKTNFGVNIRSEDDGETWVRVDEPPLPNGSSLSREWRSVAFGNGTFVALATTGASHRVIRSVDLESIEVAGGNDGTATVNTAVSVPPSVLVKNVLGNPVPSVLVSFRVTAGDGTLTEADAVTNASGIATVGSWTLGAAGTNTLTATVAGLPDVTFSATGTVGPATQIVIQAGDEESATVGTAVTSVPSVVVRDAVGNPVPGVEVTFALGSGDGTINPASPATLTTDANGVAALTSWTLGVTAGTNTLTATIAGSDPAISTTFTATGIAPDPCTDPSRPGCTWTRRATLDASGTAVNNDWFSVTYGNGLFVAVSATGTGNRVVTSPDGVNWTVGATPANHSWNSVTHGNGLFVAVASTGTGDRVMTSPDGFSWTLRSTPADNGWVSVTYGDGLFVAVASSGEGNRVMTSPDGVNWTLQTSAADNVWRSVTYGDGLFVAVASTGEGNRVMTSPDGVNWTARVSAADNSWRGVTYGNGLFVAVSQNGTDRVMTSPDGITWTSRRAAAAYEWLSVTYGDGLFVATSITGSRGTRLAISSDGVNWTIRDNPGSDLNWVAGTYANGVFVVISNRQGTRVMNSGEIIAGPPSQLAILSQPANAVSGAAITLRVQVRDASGVPVVWSTAPVTLDFGTNAGSGTLSGTLTVNAVNGVATFSDVSLDKVGEGYTLVASSDGLTSVTSSGFDIGAGAATQIAIQAGGNQSATVGSAVTTAPSVVVRDAGGNPVPGAEVTFLVTSGGGTIDPASPATVTTNADGVAMLTSWTLGATAGANTLTATITGSDPAIVTTFTATALSVPSAPRAVVATPGTGSVDLNWAPPSDTGGGVASYRIVGPGARADSFGGAVHTSARMTGLTNGSAATYEVCAVNAAGESCSAPVTATPILASTGAFWTAHAATESNIWQSVAHGDGVLIAVAQNGDHRIMRSVDAGVTWSPIAAPAQNIWRAVTYGEGTFVAVSQDGTNRSMRSTDGGLTWEMTELPGLSAFFGIAHGNDTFVAVNGGPSSRSAYSTDQGATWTYVQPNANAYVGIAYGDGAFVAINNSSGGFRVARSLDGGATWQAIATPTPNRSWRSIAYGNGVFVVVALDGGVMRSTDGGLTWSLISEPEPNNWWSVTYGNGVFVAVAETGTHRVMQSADGGVTWLAIPSAEQNAWRSVTYAGGAFVAVAADGTNRVMRSVSPPSQIAKSDGDGQTATVGTAVATPPRVTVRDAENNLVAGVGVTFAVASGDGTVTDEVAFTDANGEAAVGSWTLGTLVGENTLTATVSGFEGSVLLFTASGTPGPAAALNLATQPVGGPSGAALESQPVIQIQDQEGNLVTSDSTTEVTVSIASGEGGTLAGTTSATAEAGVVTFSGLTLAGTVGTEYVLRFTSDPGLLAVDTDPMTVTPGAAAEMRIMSQPEAGASGALLLTQPTLEIRDAQGNRLTSDGSTQVSVLIQSGSGGTLSGTRTLTVSEGVATFTDLTLSGRVSQNYVLRFTSDPALPIADSDPVSVTAGAATQLAVTTQPLGGMASGTALATQPVVEIHDAQGNVVIADNATAVTVGLVSGDEGTLGGTTTVTAQAGVVGFTDLTLSGRVGTNYVLRFTSAPALTSVDATSVTVIAGAPSQLILQDETAGNQTATAGTAVAKIPSVVVRDAQRNGVPGISVTFEVVDGGGTIVPDQPVVTDENGIAAVASWTLGERAGSNALRATVEGLAAVTFTAMGILEPTQASALTAALAAAEARTPADYTLESWAAVTTALALPATTNAEVVAKTEALNAALAALVFSGQAALDAAVTAAGELTSTDYTEGTWAAVIAALALPVTSNAEVVTKTSAINSAMAALVFSGQADLTAAVAAAEALSADDYTSGTWAAVTAALALPDTTNAQVLAKSTALNEAIAALVLVSSANDLTAAVTAAGALTATDYSEATWAALVDALALPATTQAEVLAKTAALNAALEGLVFAGQGALDVALSAAEARTESTYTAESWSALVAALGLPATTNGEVVAKTTAVNAALAGLQVAPPSRISARSGRIVIEPTAFVGTPVDRAPSVLVLNANNAPVSGVQVRFEVVQGGGSVTDALIQTDADGIATVGSWTLGPFAGPNALTATIVGSEPELAVTITATGLPIPPAGLSYPDSLMGTFGVAGESGVPNLEISGGAPVQFSITSPSPVPAGITVDSITGVVRWTSMANAGTYLLEVTASNVAGAVSTVVTLALEQALVMVTPGAGQSKTIREADPVFFYTLAPAVPVTGGLGRVLGEGVGVYAYTLGTLSPVSPNYRLILSPEARTFEIRSGLPGAPENFGGTAGDQSVSLDWIPPAFDGASPLTGYVVEYRTNGGDWVRVEQGLVTSAQLTGLENERLYRFRVAARNANGVGAFTDPGIDLAPRAPVPSTTGDLPELDPGEGSASVDGEIQTLTVEVIDSTSVRMTTEQVDLTVTGLTEDGQPVGVLPETTVLSLQVDGSIDIGGSGFAPGTAVSIWLFSAPTFVGQALVDGLGRFEARLPVPRGIAIGAHTLQVNGITQDARQQSVALGVMITGQEDLRISVSSSQSEPRVGDEITLEIRVLNAGSSPAGGVIVSQVLNDARLQILEATATHGTVDLERRQWLIGQIGVSETVLLTLRARVLIPDGIQEGEGQGGTR